MEFPDIAEQLEKLVALIEGHPVGSACALGIVLLILGFQKDGLFSKALSFLEARATLDAAKEDRRLEIIKLIESRNQPMLPGFNNEEDTRP